MTGELVYFTIGVPDTRRAQAFYGALLGWRFEQGTVPDGYQIGDSKPPGGLHGAAEASSPQVYFAVEGLDSAVAQVRELGGHAEEPQRSAHGSYASCRDDQGTRFSLYEAPDAEDGAA